MVLKELQNKVLCCDNLSFLSNLDDDIIDLIYIDPPFHSNVDYIEFNDKWVGLQQYLQYMKIRIEQMYRILKKTGSFYLHSDPHASHYLKTMCDDIFGYDNFHSEIIWNVKSVSGFKSQKQGWIRSHDVILYYTKTNEFTFNKSYLPYSINYLKKYDKEDDIGLYKMRDGKKYHLKNKMGLPISDVWNDIYSYQTRTMCDEYRDYKYPTMKPLELVERIILASSNIGDLVGDFFMGSGTFLSMAKRNNRYYLGCDINQKAVKITNERLQNTVPKNLNTF